MRKLTWCRQDWACNGNCSHESNEEGFELHRESFENDKLGIVELLMCKNELGWVGDLLFIFKVLK